MLQLLQQELPCNAVTAEYPQCTHTGTPTCSSHRGTMLYTTYVLASKGTWMWMSVKLFASLFYKYPVSHRKILVSRKKKWKIRLFCNFIDLNIHCNLLGKLFRWNNRKSKVVEKVKFRGWFKEKGPVSCLQWGPFDLVSCTKHNQVRCRGVSEGIRWGRGLRTIFYESPVSSCWLLNPPLSATLLCLWW